MLFMSKFRRAADSVSTSNASESDEVADDAPDVAHEEVSEKEEVRRASSAARARAPAESGAGDWRGGWSALPVRVSAQLMVDSGRGASPSQSGEEDSSDDGPAEAGDAKTPDMSGDGVRWDTESGW